MHLKDQFIKLLDLQYAIIISSPIYFGLFLFCERNLLICLTKGLVSKRICNMKPVLQQYLFQTCLNPTFWPN